MKMKEKKCVNVYKILLMLKYIRVKLCNIFLLFTIIEI